MKKRIFALLLTLALLLGMTLAYAAPVLSDDEILVDTDEWTAMDDVSFVEYGGEYNDPYEVALYLHCFEELPPNYIRKGDARRLGWQNGYTLWEVAYGTSIGGDTFSNREGLLPEKRGRKWYECDVNYNGERSRGGERLLFSSDGIICYSQDHYNTYTELYDGWYYEDGYYRGIGGNN